MRSHHQISLETSQNFPRRRMSLPLRTKMLCQIYTEAQDIRRSSRSGTLISSTRTAHTLRSARIGRNIRDPNNLATVVTPSIPGSW